MAFMMLFAFCDLVLRHPPEAHFGDGLRADQFDFQNSDMSG